jgi:hypothetical protein
MRLWQTWIIFSPTSLSIFPLPLNKKYGNVDVPEHWSNA